MENKILYGVLIFLMAVLIGILVIDYNILLIKGFL